MFETEVDGTPIPCDHPISRRERVLAWWHKFLTGPDFDRERIHVNPDWLLGAAMCEAYDRVYSQYPCRTCEMQREYEYGVLFPDDKAVMKRWGREEWGEGEGLYPNDLHDDDF